MAWHAAPLPCHTKNPVLVIVSCSWVSHITSAVLVGQGQCGLGCTFSMNDSNFCKVLSFWISPEESLGALQAKPNMVKSTVVDNDTGKSIDSTVRTSTGTFFGREVRHFQVYILQGCCHSSSQMILLLREAPAIER